MTSLAHVRTWIFDLDNTLYPAGSSIMASVEARMGEYIERHLDLPNEAAVAVQKAFFHQHGTTLRGLMNEHRVDPHHFLSFVHDVDVGGLDHAAALVAGIAALPGRKLIFTNADSTYAKRVLARLGLEGSFEAIYDVHAMEYWPKPDARAYAGLCAAHGVDPETALFVDDMARNLAPAKAIGMTTVWIDNGSEQGPTATAPDFIPDFVDVRVTDLEAWLTGVVAELESA